MSVFPQAYATYWNTRATAPRRVTPHILAAIHITDNPGLMSAMNEAQYSNRIGTGASFTFVNNRNGSTVQCLHPEWQVPFTNGAWTNPNYNLWSVNHALRSGIGANDSTFMTIENVGRESIGAPLTNEQIEKCAQLIAHGSRLTGIKPDRATVLGHRDYDSYNRYNCPTSYNLDYLLGRIINRANQLLAPVAPAPAPVTDDKVGGMDVIFTNRTGWKATLMAGKPMRTGARLSSPSWGTTGADVPFTIWGQVSGEAFGTNGTAWFFGPLYVRGANRVVYVPIVDLKNRQF